MNGDEIIWCDSIISNQDTNNQRVNPFDQLRNKIGSSKGKHLAIYIRRNGEVLHIVVNPREWSGKGLTGMTIISS